MKIELQNWKKFNIEELFETAKGKVPTGASVPVQDLIDGLIPRISVTNINNGISGYYDYIGTDLQNYRVYENFISVSFLGTVFYHKEKASLDMKVHCLKPSGVVLSKYTGEYLVSVIEKHITNVNYSDQISSSVLAKMPFFLPATPSGEPDWEYMENYMREMEAIAKERLQKLEELRRQKKRKIDVSGWGEFHLYDLFEISMGNKFDKSKMNEFGDDVNFVGRSALNNGVACSVAFVEDKEGNSIVPYKVGDITIALGGSIGSCFIQDRDFYTSQNVCVLHNDAISDYSKRFIVTSIYASCANYEAFVDELNRHIKTDFIIKLPITPSGEPDWEYMENYMKDMEAKAKERLSKLKPEFS